MITVDWVERQFSFDLPGWMFPYVLERLRGTPARLQQRVAPLAASLLTKQVGDAWSIQENVGHLLDLEPLWSGRLDEFLAGQQSLSPADMTNTKTYEAKHNARSIEEIVNAFQEARLDLVMRLERCDEATVLRSAYHARLERQMRLIDLVQFIAEHDDHHLAEITAILTSFHG